MMEVMLSLNTLSIEHNAVILDIAAVKFDPHASPGTISSVFYCPVDIYEYTLSEPGRYYISPATMGWWLAKEQREVLTLTVDADNKLAIRNALSAFAEWYGTTPMPTWCHGVPFHNEIIRYSFLKEYDHCPFYYAHDRCFATLSKVSKLLHQPEYDAPEVGNSIAKVLALSHAMAQANYVQTFFSLN